MRFVWLMPSKLIPLNSFKRNHPNAFVLERNNTEVVNFAGEVLPLLPRTVAGQRMTLITLSIQIKSFYVYADKLPVPLHHIINTVEIVCRFGYERTLVKEMTLEKVLPLSSSC